MHGSLGVDGDDDSFEDGGLAEWIEFPWDKHIGFGIVHQRIA